MTHHNYIDTEIIHIIKNRCIATEFFWFDVKNDATDACIFRSIRHPKLIKLFKVIKKNMITRMYVSPN